LPVVEPLTTEGNFHADLPLHGNPRRRDGTDR
jgi:hypothetical protein